jgi:glycosyltransferase involved in cell wall biosynthesis
MSFSTEANQQGIGVCLKARSSWIFFALNSKPTSMRRALSERIAESEPTVIIENPISMVRSRSIPSLHRRKEPLAGDTDSWKYHPLHFPERIAGLAPIIKSWNRRLLRFDISRLSPDSGLRIVCYDSPSQYHIAGKLKEHISVYLAVDDRTLTVWGEPIRGELEDEKRLLARVDKVICVSEPLAETLKRRLPKDRRIPIYVLSNGFDERLFDPRHSHPEPQILANIPKPRILITGHISERIDWSGILNAAKARPKWNWVFVGPADLGLREKIGGLNESLNEDGQSHRRRFHFFPQVPVSEVPSLIAHCDLCAVPYRLNPFTLASSPLKGIEYLAMGAPVLSTRIPSLMQYDRAIHWVEEGNGESYAQALDRLAGEMNNPAGIQARRAAVAGDAWADRLREFRNMVLSGQDQ